MKLVDANFLSEDEQVIQHILATYPHLKQTITWIMNGYRELVHTALREVADPADLQHSLRKLDNSVHRIGLTLLNSPQDWTRFRENTSNSRKEIHAQTFRPEIFPPQAQQALAQEMEAVLRSYLNGAYQNLSQAMSDLIVLSQKRLVSRAMIRLNNHLGYLVDRWQGDIAVGGRPTEQEMQQIIEQLLPVVVQALIPDTLEKSDETELRNTTDVSAPSQ